MSEASTWASRPVHLWVVGIISLLWNMYGAVDYLMTQTHNAAYLSNFSPEQRAYFASFPPLLVTLWALGVWGALAGSLLLLLRSRHAVAAFALSLAGLAGSTLAQFTILIQPDSLRTAGMLAMNVVIWAVAISLWIYARKMAAIRALR